MLPLITTRIKDDLLTWLCANVRIGRLADIDHTDLLIKLGIDFDSLHALLEDLEEMKLIDSLTFGRNGEDGVLMFALRPKAHALLQSGGFIIMDALNEANMQKMLLDLKNLEKQLKPDQVDVFNKITSIASSIATVLVAFSGKD